MIESGEPVLVDRDLRVLEVTVYRPTSTSEHCVLRNVYVHTARSYRRVIAIPGALSTLGDLSYMYMYIHV